MRIYNVEQISRLTGAKLDTVRRWINSKDEAHRLVGTKDSRKGGFVVTEEALKEFLQDKPKYLNKINVAALGGAAVNASNSTIGMQIAGAGAMAGVVAGTALLGPIGWVGGAIIPLIAKLGKSAIDFQKNSISNNIDINKEELVNKIIEAIEELQKDIDNKHACIIKLEDEIMREQKQLLEMKDFETYVKNNM